MPLRELLCIATTGWELAAYPLSCSPQVATYICGTDNLII
jgi:hypothetical protein